MISVADRFSTSRVVDLGLGTIAPIQTSTLSEDAYAPPAGLTELREHIASRHRAPLESICITAGASLGLASIIATLGSPGEILCPRPYYPAYPETIRAFGHTPIFYELREEQRWTLDVEQLRRDLSANTRAIILNNPGNPTGNYLDSATAAALGDLLRKWHGCTVISDEVASEFMYDAHVLPAYEHFFEPKQFVQVRSFSKAFAAPALRIGYCIGHRERILRMCRAHWSLSLGASLLTQRLLCSMLRDEGWKRIDQLRGRLRENRRLALEAMPQRTRAPEGGIFLWYRTPLADTAQFCRQLSNERGIIVMPGEAFGASGFIRVCFGAAQAQLIAGVEGIQEYVRMLERKEGG